MNQQPRFLSDNHGMHIGRSGIGLFGGTATPLAGDRQAKSTGTDDPKDAKNFTTTGDYPADPQRLEKDYGAPPIHANPDLTE